MKSKASKIISKVVLAAVGVLLVLNPNSTLEGLIRFLGIALLLIGVFGIISYAASPIKGIISTILFVLAIVVSLLALVPVINPSAIVAIFPIVVGIAIAVSGIGNLIEAISLKNAVGAWFVPLVLSLLTIAAGFVIMTNPFSTTALLLRVVGVVLIFTSIVGLFNALSYKPQVMQNGVVDISNMN
ncbi:MAG: DUF308 domain-containing protein [Clostridia bacterium]|nr:DUF308 domain-containing protein [Clostridia bacterium]